MLADLKLQNLVVPAGATFVFLALLRFVLRSAGDDAPPLASGAAPLGFLVGVFLILGVPSLPPSSLGDKLTCLVLIGALAGMLLDLVRPRGPAWLMPAACVTLPAVIAAWMLAPPLAALDTFALFAAALLWLAGALAFLRLARARGDAPLGLAPGVLLLMAGLGATAVVGLGESPTLPALAGALTAAFGVVLLWNWVAVMAAPAALVPFGRMAILGGASALLAIAGAFVLQTETGAWPLLFLLPIFYAHLVSGDRPNGDGRAAGALRPLLLIGVSAAPLVLLAMVFLVLSILSAT